MLHPPPRAAIEPLRGTATLAGAARLLQVLCRPHHDQLGLALADAEACVQCDEDWPKGHFRLGSVKAELAMRLRTRMPAPTVVMCLPSPVSRS